MKINLIFLSIIIPLLHASALGHAQTINLNKKNVSIEEIFKALKHQTDYDFVYSKKQLEKTTRVTVVVKNATINEVLDQCFENQSFSYTIEDKTIIIKDNIGKTPSKESIRSGAINISGKVTDSLGKPLFGATVKILGKTNETRTDEKGNFSLTSEEKSGTLVIAYIGYKTKEIPFSDTVEGLLTVIMSVNESDLNEVEVVSTGYQTLPKERATGSFVILDSASINRRVSTSILDRLEGITSGLAFNKNLPGSANNAKISVRGRSTIFANANPLIVLDNFPYEGDLNNINPSDIASITVLKDAAAASIWGVRAGNGVIVISTKKGKRNSSPLVSLDASVNITGKPDLNYTRQLGSAEYLEVEHFLFNKGYFNSKINNGYEAISPAVAIMLKRRSKLISASDSLSAINTLKTLDVRKDINHYLNRSAVNQQYLVGVSGGGATNQYYLSAGYDKNLQNTVTDSYHRITLNARQQYSFLSDKLKWNTAIIFAQSTAKANNSTFVSPFPYASLADENGSALAVVKDLRKSYVDTAGKGSLLDWRYIPLNDNRSNTSSGITDYRINTDLSYQIISPLSVSASYVYEKGLNDSRQSYAADSYFTRNYLNTYSRIDPLSGAVIRAIPPGDIADQTNSNYQLQTGRLQLNYNQIFNTDHQLSALAGFEVRDNQSRGATFRLYGYDPSTGTNGNSAISYTQDYPQYYGSNSGRIPSALSGAGSIDRGRSYYANGAYSYKQRYLASASARWDESNIFGVRANQKGVPLWSAGLAWIISQESFFPGEVLPTLKLRATYGYNGNVDKTATAYLTSRTLGGLNDFNNPYLIIVNPPNPSLRWEKVKMVNVGLDFNFKNQVITGTIEYYQKNSTDLIANSPLPPQTGQSQFRGNAADMRTKGIDFSLNANIFRKDFGWNFNLLLNYASDKVTSYKVKQGSNRDIVLSNYNNPLEGYPYYSIFSFPTAALDANGNPQGYLNGQLSSNYGGILNSKDPAGLIYNGPGLPPFSGNLINNFSYKSIQLSVNIGYKAGYYFRRNSVNYNNLFAGNYQQADFEKRWQQKGDEQHTSVPSMLYPANTNRNTLYTYSSALVEKGDHIRLQDIRLSYTFTKAAGLPLKNLQIFSYANNLAILWRANKYHLDPDSPFNPPVSRSFAFGVKANL